MTKTSRDDMLARIRAAITKGNPHTVVDGSDVSYDMPADLDMATRVAQFAHRVEEYKAWVGQCRSADIATVIHARLVLRNAHTMVVPMDVPANWLTGDITYVRDNQLTRQEIAACAGVITGAAVGIAQTGTIVLDGGATQGRRMLTLLPDYHLCVVRASTIVTSVPQAFAHLGRTAPTPRPAYTFVSGPSATSDIELNRVEGVHGPRTLDVCIVTDW